MGSQTPIPKAGLDHFQEQAVIAVRKAGDLLMPVVSRLSDTAYDRRADLVKNADDELLACMLESLTASFPDYNYLSYASEDSTPNKDGHLWIVDPLVGTTNFIYGYPFYAISTALLIDGEIVVGNVYNPATEELFTAAKGQGAFLNDDPIRVSTTPELNKAFLATRLPYDMRDGGPTNLGLFSHLAMQAKSIQSDGSATLDLAFVAAGRFDGFWEMRLSPWDLAAGVLLIEEAGGAISRLSGDPYAIDAEDLLATNGLIHSGVLDAIAKVPPESR